MELPSWRLFAGGIFSGLDSFFFWFFSDCFQGSNLALTGVHFVSWCHLRALTGDSLILGGIAAVFFGSVAFCHLDSMLAVVFFVVVADAVL